MNITTLVKLSLIISIAWCLSTPTSAQTYGDLGSKGAFRQSEANRKESYQYIADPTGSAPSAKVQAFSIAPGCTVQDDCLYNSVRAVLIQRSELPQPKVAWYGWNMYFPPEFVTAKAQPSRGYYTFLNFKSHNCPYFSIRNVRYSTKLSLEIGTSSGRENNDCGWLEIIDLLDIEQYRGQWIRIDMEVRWSKDSDGLIAVYINDKLVQNRKGANLLTHTTQGAVNRLGYGLYLCCTDDDNAVLPSTVLFTNLSRATTRKELLR
jgi:hypothetical protein